MKLHTLMILALAVLAPFQARAADEPPQLNIKCVKTGSGGSKVTLTVVTLGEDGGSSREVQVTIDSNIVNHNDLSSHPVVQSGHFQQFLDPYAEITSTKTPDGVQHVRGGFPYEGGMCLGSCPANHFSLDITPAGIGSYKIEQSNFSETVGKVVTDTLQSMDQMTCSSGS